MRIVIDTNVLIDAMAGEYSYGSQIMAAVCDGAVEAYASRQVMGEYQLIISRAVGSLADRELLVSFLERVQLIRAERVKGVIAEDQEDEKFLGVAVAASADAIVSSDRHLLDLGMYRGISILRPAEFVARLEEVNDPHGQQRWATWLRDITG
jgi:putative PIN family toxin of toxin-antitoxin system